LSLFAHNVGVNSGSPGQAQINAYHRIYDLHKGMCDCEYNVSLVNEYKETY